MAQLLQRTTVRSLAVAAGLTAEEALQRLREAGLPVRHTSQSVEGALLRQAREALGLRGRGEKPPPARRLTRQELSIQCLRPLREKGKVGRMHTTPFENVWGRGVPDHQKNESRTLAEEFLASGLLGEKKSQGRRHVWITVRGLALLAAIEREG